MIHPEHHRLHRSGWLRAAVLGANDGLISTSSLLIGVSAAGMSQNNIVMTVLSGLFAGAFSMAAGEYISVKSQHDTEQADLELERKALETNFDEETEELAEIYANRGLNVDLALEVAKQLMAHDALEAHARDEIGITPELQARPIQAAMSSAFSFAVGAFVPLLVAIYAPGNSHIWLMPTTAILALFTLGVIAAKTGGASAVIGGLRVSLWGAAAMFLTGIMGELFGGNI